MRTRSMREAPERIGVSPVALKKWARARVFRPSLSIPLDVNRVVWR